MKAASAFSSVSRCCNLECPAAGEGDLKLLEVLHRLRSRQRFRVSSARYARCCAVEPSEGYFVVGFGLKVLRTQPESQLDADTPSIIASV